MPQKQGLCSRQRVTFTQEVDASQHALPTQAWQPQQTNPCGHHRVAEIANPSKAPNVPRQAGRQHR